MIYFESDVLTIRDMKIEDADIFYSTYLSYGWHPSTETYIGYYKDQEQNKRKVFVAVYEGKVAGICTLVLNPDEGPFGNKNIPEIVDFNVFFDKHSRGIGTKILDVVEEEAAKISNLVYLAVGIHSGYGPAQRMYIKRGYIPDGTGAWYQGKHLEQYAPCCSDDDLVLFLSKDLHYRRNLMNYKILHFDKSMLHLLPRSQQPFDIIGRLVPTYDGTEWRTEEQLLNQKKEKTYPYDSFDPMEYIDNPEQSAFLAFLNEECVGSIRVCKRWNGNAFIDDLAIDREHRGHGVGSMLMDAAVHWGKEKGLYGVSLETQDWNILACRFYLKYGFKLGGIDTKVYTHPLYKGETALYFYMNLDK